MKPSLPVSKMIPELSIVIVNFNTAKLTLACVDSVINSKPNIEYEIIVVDNGSSETLPPGNFLLVRSSENLGFAKAVNQGIKKSKGSFVLLLNSDAKVKTGAIEKLLVFAKGHSDAGAVVPQLLNSDGSIQASCYRLPTIGKTIRQYWFGQKGILDKYVPETETVEASVMAAFLITPVALSEVGLLDERYFMYFEDLDYCRRLMKKGLTIYYLQAAQVTHYHGASGKNLVSPENQWKRLIPSSKIYHGWFGHYLFNGIIWLGQRK